MDINLLNTWSKFYKKAVEESLSMVISKDTKDEITNKIQTAIGYDDDARAMALSLKDLKNYIMDEAHIQPEVFSAEFGWYFLADDDIWDWVYGMLERDNVEEFDSEAASVLSNELKELVDENKIFNYETEVAA